MARNSDIPKNVKCSFCGKAQETVKRIVAGPGVYICDECIELCNNIIETDGYDEETYTIEGMGEIPNPKEIKNSHYNHTTKQVQGQMVFSTKF